MKKQIELRKLIFSSSLVALAIVLEVLTDFVPGLNINGYNGGNYFGLSMLPIILVGFSCGWYYGLFGGLIFGVINWAISGHDYTAWSWALDYIIPAMVLGLGFFLKPKNKIISFIGAILLGSFLRYVVLSISGVTIWAAYAEGNLWFYSFVLYNGPYMLTSTVLCLVVGVSIWYPYNSLTRKLFYDYTTSNTLEGQNSSSSIQENTSTDENNQNNL
ncbi:MAG: energy-coupled thiamine transporter ThiT [Acholeplasmatales bacterium]|jgi:thiamine transporter|nr:energy-coupled thiamine transporter ThiT [Acholeplasmatales bacterium]